MRILGVNVLDVQILRILAGFAIRALFAKRGE
jgi:hypothetical protein